MDKDIFDIIVAQFVDERLDGVMMQDGEYVKLEDEIWAEKEKCSQLDIPETQYRMLENLISLHIKAMELYGKNAYRQGFLDCVLFLQKIGVIKTDRNGNTNV